MVDGANLWQLRADCLRSFGRYLCESSEGQVRIPARTGQDYRLQRHETLKATPWDEPSDTYTKTARLNGQEGCVVEGGYKTLDEWSCC